MYRMLSWCFLIQIYGYGYVYEVRQPGCNPWLHAGLCAERGAYSLQQYVCSAEGQAYSQCRAHAAFAFSGRKACSDDAENKGGKRCCDAFVILYLEVLQSGNTSYALPADELVKLRRGHGFLHFVCKQEVLWFQLYDAVNLGIVFYFFARTTEFPDIDVSQGPLETYVRDGVVLCRLCGEM